MSYDSAVVPINPYLWVEQRAIRQMEPGCFDPSIGWDARDFVYRWRVLGDKL